MFFVNYIDALIYINCIVVCIQCIHKTNINDTCRDNTAKKVESAK